MARRALTLRWSWRDLRKRWILVTTIALILAIGTATYASLGGTAAWRYESNDASFAVTRLHDLRARLNTGNLADAGQMIAAASTMPGASAVTGMEERLLWPVQLDVPTEDGSALVRGHVVGAPLDATVDLVWLTAGRPLGDGDTGAVLLEHQFAVARDLRDSGTVELSGGRPVSWVGHAQEPEFFMGGMSDDPGSVLTYMSAGSYGVLFASLATAQELAGAPGKVNDLVLTVAPGTDVAALEQQLTEALATELPGAGVTVSTKEDVEAYRVLYEDIEGDQQVWNIVSWLVLLGASFAAFNLITRIVEASRREIGVGMALGVSRRELAVRPLLVGIQVALLGVVAGIGVGLLLNALMKNMFTTVLPLPVWRTPFQYASYGRAVAIGLALPFVATLLPVWRAVRVEPVQAIRTGHFATGSSGWARLGSHSRWPKRSIGQYPVRNLLRNVRRTVLTALGIAAAIVVLIGIIGMLDTFVSTVDRTDAALTYEGAGRLTVQLDGFVLAEGDVVTSVQEAPGIGTVSAGLSLPGELRRAGGGDDGFETSLDVLPFATAPWAPEVTSGVPPSLEEGILLAEKAAEDLGVGPGGTVLLRHPVREGMSYRMVDSEVRVAGTHPIALRSLVYLDSSQADLFGLDGITNTLQVTPEPGVTADQAQRALFALPGVAAAMPVVDLGDTLRSLLDQFMGVLRVMEGAVLLLALLIAFNSTSVAVDERSREHATMFAFGLPVRTVVRMTVVEAMVVGVLGTLLGVVLGYAVLQYLFHTTLPNTMPDIGFDVYLSPATLTAAALAGVAVVALAPLFTVRKLRRMDVPATLRVVE